MVHYEVAVAALISSKHSEPAVHSGLFLNALISCAPWGGLLADEAGAAAAVEEGKYTFSILLED